jgi:DNA-binding protein
MENYRKEATSKSVPCTELNINGPHIRISSNGRVRDYLIVFEKFLKQKESQIVVSGVGMAVNKTVSVAEIIKRQYKLKLETTIFDVAEIDLWNSIDGTLDPLEVTRHLPGIKFVIHT